MLGSLLAAPIGLAAAQTDWIELFDGHSLNGWKPSENKSSWKVVDGMLAADGPRSHLFYAGALKGADFRNFELEVELTTKPECNSGIYFHTKYQESGFPEKGFEIQVNNTAKGDGGYLERKKTCSLYGLRNMYKQLVPDDVPFRVHATVRGKNVQIRLNGELVVDYVEPTPPIVPAGGEKQRYLDHGTFALQCHNDGSRAFYSTVRVRPLQDDLPAYTSDHPQPVADDVFRQLIDIGRHNVPLVDFDVALAGGLTLEDSLRRSRRDGIQYGITALAAEFHNSDAANRWLEPMARKPVFLALTTQTGEWTRSISHTTAKRFDYVLGKSQSSVDEAVKRLDSEPMDIYRHTGEASPTERTKLIEALVRNKVALELNSTDQTPSRDFIQTSKEAGCKFVFGTGNKNAAGLKRCEYGLQMVEACQLDWHNFYVPGAWWPKAVERRWPSAN